MLSIADPIVTETGHVLYRDDADVQRFYTLPSALTLARAEDGASRFMLVFYQGDVPERGARLVAAFSPDFPDVTLDAGAGGADMYPRIEGVAFWGGEMALAWPGFESPPCLVENVAGSILTAEVSLSQDEARLLRQTLKAGGVSISVRARLSYISATRPLPGRARINLHVAAQALRDSIGDEEVEGTRLRHLLSSLPPEALRFEPVADPPMPSILPEETTLMLAPLVAARIAEIRVRGLTFELSSFRLLDPEQIPNAELTVDLSRSKSWQGVWEGEWSLSAFYQEVEQAGELSRYFPEVSNIPPVGTVNVLVENLLPVDGRCLDEVMVTLRHKRLGSLEEDVFKTGFRATSAPVVQHRIPKIAFTDFVYHYLVQVRLAAEEPSAPGARLFPEQPQWLSSSAPILRVGHTYLPLTFAYLAAQPEVFDHVARVDIEVAAADDDEPRVIRQVALTPEETYRWVTLPQDAFANHRLRWRALLHAEVSGQGKTIVGTWQMEASLRALVTLAHVLPRQPLRVEVEVISGSIDEVEAVQCELASGRVGPLSGAADVRWTFVADEMRAFAVWPQSIFDAGVSYRYAIVVADPGKLWTEWRYQTDMRVTMKVEDDFYATRTISLTLAAPWSQRNSPDASTTAGEIIFAEVHLQMPTTSSPQSVSHTFDKTNVGTELRWKIRTRKDENQYVYEVHALAADGQMLKFGPFESEADRVSLELYRIRVSDTSPAEFGLRTVKE
jgi:hypothetical protein